MRRWICLGMCALCVLGLCYVDALWGRLSDQLLYQLLMEVDKEARDSLVKVATGNDMELGAFALGEAKLGTAGTEQEILLRECLVYHPEALGILMITGSPITHSQIEGSEAVVMLSLDAALKHFPTINCIDAIVELNGTPHRVVGVYQEDEPLGPTTRTASASAITPMRVSNGARKLYVWLRPKKASSFAFQHAKSQLDKLSRNSDLGVFQATDIGRMSQMNRQGVRFWQLLLLSVLCCRLLQMLTKMRRRFYQHARSAFSKQYGLRACAELIWPVMWGLLPSLALIICWIGYFIYCANRLLISAEHVPKQLLDPSAWWAKLIETTISVNISTAMPVFSYLLNSKLQWVSLILGLLGLWFLWTGLKLRIKKADE